MAFSSAHLAAIVAFSMWGLFPIYWKAFSEVSAWDLFAARLIWSFITLILILFFKKKLSVLKEIWKSKRTRWMLIASAILISSNWLLYIYAISIGKILEASMGYFLNPIINVFFGWILLKEKIRSSQWPAIFMAILAIIFMALQSDLKHFPWIALVLSLTFAVYGLIRKVAHVGALEGLTFETSIVVIPTLVFWLLIPSSSKSLVEVLPIWKILLLLLSGLITCAPLVLFAYSTKRLPMSTLGFIQYLSPSLKFICGWLIFNEPLAPAQLQAFGLIWLALAWYSLESFLFVKKSQKMNVAIAE